MTIKKNIYYLFYSLLIILFIIVLILKIVYYLNIYYFENNNCEDKYHQNNELRKGKCRHKLKFLLKNLSEKKFLELVNYLKKNLINFLRSILNKHLLNIPDIKILFILMPSKVSSIKIKRNEVSERGAARVNAFLAEILIRKSARNALLLAEASKKNAARKNVLNSYTKKTSPKVKKSPVAIRKQTTAFTAKLKAMLKEGKKKKRL